MSKIHLTGVGMTGLYQLVGMTHSAIAPAFPGNDYPLFGIFLLNCSTGELVPAESMPVTVEPGFMIQGEHNRFGSTSVTHCSVSGDVVPKEVKTFLGAALPIRKFTKGTGFTLNNSADLTKTKLFAERGSTYSTLSAPRYYFSMENLYYTSAGLVGSTTIERYESGWRLYQRMENSAYIGELSITCTGNLFSIGLYGRPSYKKGSYKYVITIKSTGGKSTSSGSTTGLFLHPWTAPCDLSSISTELVLSSIGDLGDTAILRDLSDLLDLDEGNSSWLACYNAVESTKRISFEGMEYARDMFNITELKPPLQAFLALESPKAWAEIFLWLHYGVIPSIGSAFELYKALRRDLGGSVMDLAKRFAIRTSRYATVRDESQTMRGNTVHHTCNARCTISPQLQPMNLVDALVTVCKYFNLLPSATNIWELLPYSFVVDWFANTSTIVKYVDYTAYPTVYDVDEILLSHKWEVDLPANLYLKDATGTVHLKAYTRRILSSFPAKPPELAFTDPSNHWLEASTLLVSMFS